MSMNSKWEKCRIWLLNQSSRELSVTNFLRYFGRSLRDHIAQSACDLVVPQGLLFGEGRPYLWAGFFRFVSPRFGRLSCITRRPWDIIFGIPVACSYFSFSKVDLRLWTFRCEWNDRAIRDFSRFSAKNNCMLLRPNCRNWSKYVKILSAVFHKNQEKWKCWIKTFKYVIQSDYLQLLRWTRIRKI